jgi:hypothetical protein
MALNNKNSKSFVIEYKKSTETTYNSYVITASGYEVGGTVIMPADSGSSYNIRLVVADAFTTVIQNTFLQTALTIMNFKADGTGVGAGKISEESYLWDFGFPVRLGGGLKVVDLPNGTNFNDATTLNTYNLRNAKDAGYVNCPYENGTGTLTIEACGEVGQLHQIVEVCSKTNPMTYERFYYGNAWGEWLCTSCFGGKVLWSGGMYMQASHTITLSEAVSKQPTGIELVFSRYENGTVFDYDFSHHFVSKKSVAMHNDTGHSFVMSDANFKYIGAKYLIITDTVISGDVANTASATASGITFNNKNWVLRYVIGV